MTKTEVIDELQKEIYPSGIAEVICDIACNGKVVYPNESILVIVEDGKDAGIAEDQIIMHKHWCLCDNINDFQEGIVYGREEAIATYCKHYVSEFKSVQPFVTDFSKK